MITLQSILFEVGKAENFRNDMYRLFDQSGDYTAYCRQNTVIWLCEVDFVLIYSLYRENRVLLRKK